MSELVRILAATDLSEPARHAVERGVRLAGQSGAAVTVMHVVSRGAMDSLRRLLGAESAPIERHILDAARVSLETLAGEPGPAGRAAVDTCLVAGVVVDEIAGRADALGASLLVVGARGEGFLRQALFGTTSERLLRRTSRPMLVVRWPPPTGLPACPRRRGLLGGLAGSAQVCAGRGARGGVRAAARL